MDLSDLNAFVAVARARGFRDAARQSGASGLSCPPGKRSKFPVKATPRKRGDRPLGCAQGIKQGRFE
ncbi:hypothetical protein ATC00_28965 [Sinorhizobium americanum]|nr:hypothetical protein ATC00_28965 [Sinorhizobium americanum]